MGILEGLGVWPIRKKPQGILEGHITPLEKLPTLPLLDLPPILIGVANGEVGGITYAPMDARLLPEPHDLALGILRKFFGDDRDAPWWQIDDHPKLMEFSFDGRVKITPDELKLLRRLEAESED